MCSMVVPACAQWLPVLGLLSGCPSFSDVGAPLPACVWRLLVLSGFPFLHRWVPLSHACVWWLPLLGGCLCLA